MIPVILQIIALLASGLIFWRSEQIINVMGAECPIGVRLAFWFLIIASASLFWKVARGYMLDPSILIALCGIALLLVNERRIKGILRQHYSVNFQKKRG